MPRVRWSTIVLAMVALAAISTRAQADGLKLYVAPGGNDHWSGRLAEPNQGDGPFRTLERMRDEIRTIKRQGGLPAGGVIVELRGGVYELATPFKLIAEDSGAEGAPIIYRARPGEEVRLVGGVQVTNFQPVTDPAALKRIDPSARGKVLRADLKAFGVKDFGQVIATGNRLELFFQDKPMTLARWPNEGFVRIVDVVGGAPHRIHGRPGDKIGRFIYDGDRPTRWVGEQDIWLHGYWFWDWADQRQQVESIDPVQHTIALVPPYHSYGYRKGQWYYALNLLSELDSPGEWYLDRPSGTLYFWPPAPLDQGKALVSVIPSLVQMLDASYVTLRGLILEACRATAVDISGGTGNRIVGCTIRNTGSNAARISGRNSGVVGCDIYETGDGGVALSGGDRRTLTPAGLFADNNHIHHYSRWNRICRPAISLDGVGNRATHNLIDNAPHQAISFGGNDHLMEFNEIHSVCYESNDAGAIYSGRNWTMRGTVIRYNYFHHINGFEGRGCVGVYLDDQFCGTEVFGNVFYKVTRAAMIGGGRDCTIANNVFVDCVPATHVDARGLGWAASGFDGLKGGLKQVPYLEPPWSQRYPKLVNILDDDPMAPKGNLIARNICLRGRWGDFEAKAKPMVTFQDNLVVQDPGLVDPEHLNFQLKADSPAYKLGFERIPIEKIGLYQSPERASWPVPHAVRPMADPPPK
jgi:Right handed beta helix region